MISNDKIRERTGMEKLEDILRKRRLRWLGHVHRMDNDRIAKQAMNWSPADGKRKKGRPRKTWKVTVLEDLKIINMDWEEAEHTAGNRLMWQCRVAQCAEGTWKD
jgi:hypothetical protein